MLKIFDMFLSAVITQFTYFKRTHNIKDCFNNHETQCKPAHYTRKNIAMKLTTTNISITDRYISKPKAFKSTYYKCTSKLGASSREGHPILIERFLFASKIKDHRYDRKQYNESSDNVKEHIEVLVVVSGRFHVPLCYRPICGGLTGSRIGHVANWFYVGCIRWCSFYCVGFYQRWSSWGCFAICSTGSIKPRSIREDKFWSADIRLKAKYASEMLFENLSGMFVCGSLIC